MDIATDKVITRTRFPARRLLQSIVNFGKRLFDIAISLLALFLLAPLFAWIAYRIRRDSPGPVIYRGPRLGKGGKTFNIFKFRTMYDRPESYRGPRVTAQDDPRVTPVGRWLRATKLNELPQFWNVLTGDMSLVGPRPEDPALSNSWPRPVLQEVLSIRPGITSPATVLYRNEETLLQGDQEQVVDVYLKQILPTKLRLDQLYVRHRSFWLDLDILFWTGLVLLPRLRRLSPPVASLFRGPFSRLFQRYLSWFTIDGSVSLLAIGLSGWLWGFPTPTAGAWTKALTLPLGFVLVFSLAAGAMNAQHKIWSRASLVDFLELVPAAGLAGVVTWFVNRLWLWPPSLPDGMLLTFTLLAFSGFSLARVGSRALSGLGELWLRLRGQARAAHERVLIIGGGQAGQYAAWLLSNGQSERVFQVVGYVDDDLFKQGLRIRGVPVLGRREDIPHLVTDHDVGILVFAIHNIQPEEREKVMTICSGTSARLVMLPDILGMLNSAAGSVAGDGPWVEQPVHVPLLQVDAWLAELTSLAQSGDLSAVQARLQNLRQSLSGRNHVSPEPDPRETPVTPEE